MNKGNILNAVVMPLNEHKITYTWKYLALVLFPVNHLTVIHLV